MINTISLTQNKSFLNVYKKGKYFGSKECVFYYKQNNLPYNRLGISTSKKIGNAVMRNRARRIIKSAFSQTELLFPIGYDFVIVAKKQCPLVKSTVIYDFFNRVVVRKINNKNFKK